MFRLILKIRYGKNAKTIDRFLEFIGAAYFVILAAALPLPATLVVASGIMLLFSYAVGSQSWRVFSTPPLAIAPMKLALSLFLSTLVSAPMLAGIVMSAVKLNFAIIAVMLAANAVTFAVYAWFPPARHKKAWLVRTPPPSRIASGTNSFPLELRPVHYQRLDWQRRRLRWWSRIVIPYLLYPLGGVVVTQLLAFHSSGELSLAAVAIGASLGLVCNFMYLYTDDLPGNFVRTITKVSIFWQVLPLSCAVIISVIVGQVLQPSVTTFIALLAATGCALALGKTKSIVSDHSAPMQETVTAIGPTVVQDVMGVLLILGIYAGTFLAITLGT